MHPMTPFRRKRFLPGHGPGILGKVASLAVILNSFLFAWSPLQAQLPQARLDTIFPPGGKQGTEVEIRLTGEHLDGVMQVLFSHPGIQSDIKPDESSAHSTPPSFHISISAEVPPGFYEVRTAGYFGVSNPRCFVVGTKAEIQKQGKPHHPEQAIKVPLETIVNGTVDPQAIDHFVVSLEADRSYTIECLAKSIDSKLNPSLIVLDPKGRECARARSGGMVHFQTQHAGSYIIRLHDTLFEGGASHFYRLRTTSLPCIDLALPINGAPGQATSHVRTLATEPAQAERESNDVPEQAQTIQLPCELSGTFDPSGDVDRFQFESKKGDTWWLEVFSHRMGHPTSPFLLVQRMEKLADTTITLHDIKEVYAQTKNPLGRALDLSHRDPDWRFDVPQDGIYQVRLSDLFQHSGAPGTHPYRLSIRNPQPDFTLIAVTSHPQPINNDARTIRPSEPLLRQGMTWPLEVAVIRHDGFNGPIKLESSGLPNGIKSAPGRIAEGEDRGWIFLTASTNALSSWKSISITGSASIGDMDVVRQVKSATTLWTVDDYNNTPLEQRLANAQWVATVAEEVAPIVITPVEPIIQIATDQTVDIPLTVQWNTGAEAALKIKPVGIPSAEKLPELEIKPDQSKYTYSLNLNELTLASGNYSLSWFGQTKVKYRNQPQAAEHFKTRLQEAEAQLNEVKAAAQAAEALLAQAGDNEEQQQNAQRELASARLKLKDAETNQSTAALQAKQAEERAKQRDVDWMVYAAPITLHLSPAQSKEEQ